MTETGDDAQFICTSFDLVRKFDGTGQFEMRQHLRDYVHR